MYHLSLAFPDNITKNTSSPLTYLRIEHTRLIPAIINEKERSILYIIL